MSNQSTPGSGQRPQKTMSSRLLTMKFMQRAAASSPSPSTPQDTTPPSSKRQKTNHSTLSSPATPISDQAAIQAALEAEEAQRDAVITRVAAERGETKWVLSFVDAQKGGGGSQGMKIVKAGYGDIDGEGNEVGERGGGPLKHMVSGRRSFGNFNKELEKRQNYNSEHSSSSSDKASQADDGDQDSFEDDHAAGATKPHHQYNQQAFDGVKAQRKAEKKAAKAEAARQAEKRKTKEVKLKNLTSISGTDGGKSRNANANIECHSCGEKGHKKADCPKRGSKRKGDFDSHRPAKRSNKSGPLDY